jgi:catechol 2,3-dioxygenase-like lactoylglutathione lyase family enzyme
MKKESTVSRDRRRVLRTIGAGAAAIGAYGVLGRATDALAATAGSEMAVTTVNHLSYASQNYKVTRDFYVEFFGMRDAWDDGTKCQLDCGPDDSPNSFYLTGAKPGTEPTIGHFAFGLPGYWDLVGQLKDELQRRKWPGVHPDGEAGWFVSGPSGYTQHVVTVKDMGMFPGAAAPCESARSAKCRDAFILGVKNPATLPQPGAGSFKALYFKYFVLTVADVPREAAFYKEAMRMQPVKGAVPRPGDVALRFGENTLVLRGGAPEGKPYCNEFGLAVDHYDEARAKAELARRGITARRNAAGGLVFKDPNGLEVGISGRA